MPIDKYIGVDGCKAGWFFVAIGPADDLEIGIFETIEKLWQTYSEAKWILIDIPIGLPSIETKARPCDQADREVLSPKRHHSIFSPPCREVLGADNYPEACRINYDVCGRKISKQVWHIITALDRYSRKQLGRDDIHDGLVNAVTAACLDAAMETLPPEPTRDLLGLPMQMVYSPSWPLTERGRDSNLKK